MSVFGDALGTVGSVLDAPRSLLYKGGTALGRALGYEGPDVNNFEDLLQNAGMDEGIGRSALGMAGDIATDPLTWLGLGAAKGARALIPRGGAGSLNAAEAASAGVQADRAGMAASRGLGDAGRFKKPLADTIVLDEAKLLPAGEAASPANLGISFDSGATLEARPRRLPASQGEDQLANRLATVGQDIGAAGEQPFMEGRAASYFPDQDVIMSHAGQPARHGRHERVHAVIENAAQGKGEMGDLPYLMQAPARLRQGATPGSFRHGASDVLDELAAHTLESRSLPNQAKGALRYLFNPEHNAAYSDFFAQNGMHPLARRAYSSLPAAFVGAGGGAGGGAGALGRALLGEDA